MIFYLIFETTIWILCKEIPAIASYRTSNRFTLLRAFLNNSLCVKISFKWRMPRPAPLCNSNVSLGSSAHLSRATDVSDDRCLLLQAAEMLWLKEPRSLQFLLRKRNGWRCLSWYSHQNMRYILSGMTVLASLASLAYTYINMYFIKTKPIQMSWHRLLTLARCQTIQENLWDNQRSYYANEYQSLDRLDL